MAKLTGALNDAGIAPQTAAVSAAGARTAHRINLYQKIGRGSFDLYVASPVDDARELKEFRRQCAARAPHFVGAHGAVPLADLVSVVAAMVWKPHGSTEKPVRILLPGAAPLPKLYEGLDRLYGTALFESPSGCAEQQAPQPTQLSSKPGAASKPTSRPSASGQKPAPQLASAAKLHAPPPARARDRTAAGSVGSPRGSREAASRKPAPKTDSRPRRSEETATEPATSKPGRVAKAPVSAQPPTVADDKLERVETAAATSSAGAGQTSPQTSPPDTELPAVEVTGAEGGESIRDVKVDEPGEGEESAGRDSVERDSLEASACDDVLVDSLSGEDARPADVHSDEELDQNKADTVEQAADSDYGETRHRVVDVHAYDVDTDDRITRGFNDRTSPVVDVRIHERVDPDGELDTPSSGVNAVAQPDEAAIASLDDFDPLCKAEDRSVALDDDNILCAGALSRPVDADDVDIDEEASSAKQTATDELMATEQHEMQQEMTDDIVERDDEGAVQQDLQLNVGREFDNHYQQQPEGVEDAEVSQEPKKETGGDRETGVLPQELPSSVFREFDDRHFDHVLSGSQQSPITQSVPLSLIHISSPRDRQKSRMPSSA